MEKLLKLLCEASTDWENRIEIAGKHGVLPFLYEVCEDVKDCPDSVKEKIRVATVRTIKQSYRLLFLSKYLVTELEKEAIPVVLLKGVATASFYPVPEYRKSGDVDLLLLDADKLFACCEMLDRLGFQKKKQQEALHHVVYVSPEGIDVELHIMLAEPFDNQKINKYLEKLIPECQKQVEWVEIMGVELPILKPGYHGYELLLHMLQHFLRAGFGLKLLCDWVVFWSAGHTREEQDIYLRLVKESGLKGFSDMVTLTCCRYLGLEKAKVTWMDVKEHYDTEEFLREILEAEEFGHSADERMVALRGDGVWDYVREFHHQMRLNFPGAGKCFLLWPVLWIVTLCRFLRNNRKLRNVSAREVFAKAGQRGKIIKQMHLWEEKH
ncbi:MAG: nucleotidyltransferase family protein [Lachnospiraceae bacterium]|nr:nucleotidyltransferase family protein [Lachnospiraceae bacterium]